MPSSHPPGWYQVFPSEWCIHSQPSTSSGHLLPSSGAHVSMDGVFSGVHGHGHPACSTVILPHWWHPSIIRISINHLSSFSHGSWSVGSHHLGQSLLCFSFASVSLDCPWNCYRFSIVTRLHHFWLIQSTPHWKHLRSTAVTSLSQFGHCQTHSCCFCVFFCHLLVFVWLLYSSLYWLLDCSQHNVKSHLDLILVPSPMCKVCAASRYLSLLGIVMWSFKKKKNKQIKNCQPKMANKNPSALQSNVGLSEGCEY